MQAARGTMDGIIDTVSAFRSLLPLISLLKTGGKLVMGELTKMAQQLTGRKLVAGSVTGGLKETQEKLDFAGKHNIEVIPMDYVNVAMECLGKDDVKYRFIVDIANTLKAAEA
ncbi:hypothetical protein RJ641_010057 [Dillenia turbinata]|uniref:Alcohol dehydrogenase-like C-terminal domain-containing protein n=1 Tax=Dillenia turbinata TaxID=194707 RepID=A0AAN8V6W6_9MAGN